MRILAPLSASVLALSMAACATPPASGDGATASPAAAAARCNADAVQSAVGQQATPEVVEQARVDAGADTVRTLKPNQAITMEYLEGRLNLLVDDSNVVTGARCG